LLGRARHHHRKRRQRLTASPLHAGASACHTPHPVPPEPLPRPRIRDFRVRYVWRCVRYSRSDRQASVMIEKFAATRATPQSEFLDLNHTSIMNLLVSFRSRSSFNVCRAVRRTSRSGH
jgi:hypothetical protein